MTVLLSIITFYLLFKITNPEARNLDSSYDAIVILSGDPERAVVSSRLFFEKDAKFIYLSKEASIVKNYISPSKEQKIYEIYINILLKNCKYLNPRLQEGALGHHYVLAPYKE